MNTFCYSQYYCQCYCLCWLLLLVLLYLDIPTIVSQGRPYARLGCGRWSWKGGGEKNGVSKRLGEVGVAGQEGCTRCFGKKTNEGYEIGEEGRGKNSEEEEEVEGQRVVEVKGGQGARWQ